MNLKRVFNEIVLLGAEDSDTRKQLRASLHVSARLTCEALVEETASYRRDEMRALTDHVLASLDGEELKTPPVSVDAPVAASHFEEGSPL